jgi:hypothetical protein
MPTCKRRGKQTSEHGRECGAREEAHFGLAHNYLLQLRKRDVDCHWNTLSKSGSKNVLRTDQVNAFQFLPLKQRFPALYFALQTSLDFSPQQRRSATKGQFQNLDKPAPQERQIR